MKASLNIAQIKSTFGQILNFNYLQITALRYFQSFAHKDPTYRYMRYSHIRQNDELGSITNERFKRKKLKWLSCRNERRNKKPSLSEFQIFLLLNWSQYQF